MGHTLYCSCYVHCFILVMFCIDVFLKASCSLFSTNPRISKILPMSLGCLWWYEPGDYRQSPLILFCLISRLRGGGLIAERDIVQFVPFRDFQGVSVAEVTDNGCSFSIVFVRCLSPYEVYCESIVMRITAAAGTFLTSGHCANVNCHISSCVKCLSLKIAPIAGTRSVPFPVRTHHYNKLYERIMLGNPPSRLIQHTAPITWNLCCRYRPVSSFNVARSRFRNYQPILRNTF